jgi:hypothetical protein
MVQIFTYQEIFEATSNPPEEVPQTTVFHLSPDVGIPTVLHGAPDG